MNLSALTRIPLDYLIPAGKSILLVSFGLSVILGLRRGERIESCFVGLAIGLLGMTFSHAFIEVLCRLSDSLTQEIQKLGDAQALKQLVWESIRSAANEPGPEGQKYALNLPAIVEQLFRTGVWGIASTIADFFFLIAQSFVEVRRDILLALVQFLIPLIWGLYPIRPELGNSIISYLIEMALWGPCLYLIQIIIAHIAPHYLNRPKSLGVPMVALEIVATILILEVPRMVHQLLGGVLHPGGESTALGMIFLGSRVVNKMGQSSAQPKKNWKRTMARRKEPAQ